MSCVYTSPGVEALIVWQFYGYPVKDLPDTYPKQLHHFTFSPAAYDGPISPYLLLLVALFLFYNSHFSGCDLIFPSVLICLSIIANDVGHLFMCLLVLCLSSLK